MSGLASRVEACKNSHKDSAKILVWVRFFNFLSGHPKTIIYSREELITV